MWNTYKEGYEDRLTGFPPNGYSDEYERGYKQAGIDQHDHLLSSLDHSIAKLISFRIRVLETVDNDWWKMG